MSESKGNTGKYTACEDCPTEQCEVCDIAGFRTCPFCESSITLTRIGRNGDILLLSCGNRFTSCVHMTTAYYEGARELLRAKWNSRPELDRIRQENGRLKREVLE